MSMHVDAAGNRSPDMFNWRRLTDTCCVVVNEVALELLHLLVIENNLGKFSDTGVRSIHDFALGQFLFQHHPAHFDTFQCRRIQLDLFAIPRYANQFVDCE